MIVIVDYGMGNTGSLFNMVQKAGGAPVISSQPDVIERAQKIILPGVGSFDQAVKRLHEIGLFDLISRRVSSGEVTLLAICLGAQLVTESSEEGTLPGFGWIKGKTVKFIFEADSPLRIPHMGWNEVKLRKPHPLFHGLDEDACFYFVHSYHIVCDDPDDVLATTVYGYEFASAVHHNNIVATQFHPEKSHKYGLKLVSNFVNLSHA